ncbi:hypothetical protein CO614_07775 [Lysobacteraceae bacterium NML120232]|nr:hypothetical protein CO614_07775 [Xanthomonadaceae bacterium NML120232]
MDKVMLNLRSTVQAICRALRRLLQALAVLLLWFLTSIALLHLFERLTAERYAPGDAPHEQFQILVLQEDGQPALLALRNYRFDMQLARQDALSGRQGDHFFRLNQLDSDTWQLYADRDTFITTQRYRIEGGQLMPLAFRWRNVGHGFIAFIIALPLLWLLKRLATKVLGKKK